MEEVELDIEAQTTSNSGSSSSNNNASSGYHLRWCRLHKSVQIGQKKTGMIGGSIAGDTYAGKNKEENVKQLATKTILDQVSGSAAPGEVLALMGPSGSGKTSLLNILSGRSAYDGIVSINGHHLGAESRKKIMSKIAYVKQQDIFFDHLTVRDQLTYTALLRLPAKMPRESKIEEVDKIISLLRLGKVADSQIMLCSGGEKKRVNVGTELLTDPMVLLLDECTSGLDSTSASALINLLQQLARSQCKTVVTSIHQPSSKVFQSFDKVIMLAEGHQVYFGTPVGSLTYLSDQTLACPPGYNAADHWMDLLVRDDLAEAELGDSSNIDSALTKEESVAISIRRKSVLDGRAPREHLIHNWDNETIAQQVENGTQNNSDDDAEEDLNVSDIKKYNTSWPAQFGILFHRSLKNSRSAIITPLNLVKSAAIGVIAGLLWFQLDNTERTVMDRSSYFFFTMTYWVFDSMFGALMAFPSERTVILKERASGAYRLSAYFMAKTMSEAPTRVLLPLFYMTISFWMSGINPRFLIFISSTFCCLLSVLAGEAIGLLIGASMYDFQRALTVMTVFSLALMLLGGFFVDNVPAFISWAKFLSPFKYAYDASQQLVFDRDVPCDGSGVLKQVCAGTTTGFATPEEVLEVLNVQGSTGFNVAMLFVICTFPRYLAYLALRSKKGGERE